MIYKRFVKDAIATANKFESWESQKLQYVDCENAWWNLTQVLLHLISDRKRAQLRLEQESRRLEHERNLNAKLRAKNQELKLRIRKLQEQVRQGGVDSGL